MGNNGMMTREQAQRQAAWKAADRQRKGGQKPAAVEKVSEPQQRVNDDSAAFGDIVAKVTRFMKGVRVRSPLPIGADTVCIRFVAAVATDCHGMLELRERSAKVEDAAPKGTETFRSKEEHAVDLSALLRAGFRLVDAYKTEANQPWCHAFYFWFAKGRESTLALPGGVNEATVKRFFAASWARVVVYDNPATDNSPRLVTINLTKREPGPVVRLLALQP